MVKDKLAIAGQLTWQQVVESIDGFYEGRGGCASTLKRGQAKKAAWVEILFFLGT